MEETKLRSWLLLLYVLPSSRYLLASKYLLCVGWLIFFLSSSLVFSFSCLLPLSTLFLKPFSTSAFKKMKNLLSSSFLFFTDSISFFLSFNSLSPENSLLLLFLCGLSALSFRSLLLSWIFLFPFNEIFVTTSSILVETSPSRNITPVSSSFSADKSTGADREPKVGILSNESGKYIFSRPWTFAILSSGNLCGTGPRSCSCSCSSSDIIFVTSFCIVLSSSGILIPTFEGWTNSAYSSPRKVTFSIFSIFVLISTCIGVLFFVGEVFFVFSMRFVAISGKWEWGDAFLSKSSQLIVLASIVLMRLFILIPLSLISLETLLWGL